MLAFGVACGGSTTGSTTFGVDTQSPTTAPDGSDSSSDSGSSDSTGDHVETSVSETTLGGSDTTTAADSTSDDGADTIEGTSSDTTGRDTSTTSDTSITGDTSTTGDTSSTSNTGDTSTTGEGASSEETGALASTSGTETTGDPTDGGGSTEGGPNCGNGMLDPGEACDDGQSNGDGSSACSTWCTIDFCGDGYHHDSEACDDGTLNGNGQSPCTAGCELNICGDLYLYLPNESCDEGLFATTTCDVDCTSVVCGDGLVNEEAQEECDDGDAVDDNGCSNACYPTVDELSVGDGHACVLGPAGNVRCWGENTFGRLGYGNLANIGDNEVPSTAGDVDVGGVVVQVAAGTFSTCALLDGGSLRCWGYGAVGQLGYGNGNTIGDNETPASAGDMSIGEDVLQVSVGGRHACAVVGIGLVRCWGEAESGQLGYGNTTDIGDNEAVSLAGIVDIGALASEVVAGENHTCALLDDGAVRCWGRGDIVGYPLFPGPYVGDNEVPADMGNVDVGGTAVQLALGALHTCARLEGGTVRCWGRGDNGKLGYGNTNNIGILDTPASAGDVDIGGNAVDITAGRWHTCALLDDGAVRCWGFGGTGALGYGNGNDIGDGESPASAGDVDVGGDVIDLESGDQYTCALLADGRVKCWGRGDFGVLGYGNVVDIGDNETPAAVGFLEL